MTVHLVEIDPRPCAHCGMTIDEHFTIDQGDGPEHFCQPLDVVLHLRAAALQEAWECADLRDAWMHTGEAPPPTAVRNTLQPVARNIYRTPRSTRDAFWFVIALKEPDRLVAWLRDHERDAPLLLKLLEAKDA